MHQFAGKVALVTGGSTGIGRQAALDFAKAGARVVVADTAAASGEQTAHDIVTAGGEAIFVPVDVSRTADVAALIDKTVTHFGNLDCALNNAGIAPRGTPVAEMAEGDWDRTVGINLKGVWACLKYECAQMLRQGTGGAIVNISSIMGGVPFR